VLWRRQNGPGWRTSIAINAAGAVATAVVAAIIGVTKFADGAWLSMALMALLALAFWSVYRHYNVVARLLELPQGALVHPSHQTRQIVLVPVGQVDRVSVHAAEYARTLSESVTALHVTDDASDGKRVRLLWESTVLDVPMVVIHSPFRSLVTPVLSYVDAMADAASGRFVTVVLPEYQAAWPWQRWLHNQSARRLRQALLDRRDTAVAEIPFRAG
jgi:hypothetical protein